MMSLLKTGRSVMKSSTRGSLSHPLSVSFSNYNVVKDSVKNKRQTRRRSNSLPSYCFFIGDPVERMKIKARHPGITPREVMREMAARWRALTDEEKVPYQRKATVDRARYEKEKEAFEKFGLKLRKKGLSSYAFYCMDKKNRQAVRREKPGLTGRETMRELAARWKLLTDEEKEPYVEKAAIDKAYCLKFIPPKHNRAANSFFFEENFKKLQEENPGYTPADIMKEIAARWKLLSDVEKAPYKKMAAIDKTRYTKEKFDPPPQTILPAYLLFVRDRQMRQAVLDENPELSTAGVMTELAARWQLLTDAEKAPYVERAAIDKARNEHVTHPKNPLPAYTFFLKDKKVHAAIRQENPDIATREMIKELARRWRLLTDAERAPYDDEAAVDVSRFEKEKVAFALVHKKKQQ